MRSPWALRVTISLVSAAAALLLSAQASAQASIRGGAPEAAAASQPQAESPQTMDEVVARGRRLSEVEFNLRRYIREFVVEVTAPPRGQGHARWHRSVCVGVYNLEKTAAQYIVDRISILAAEVGLDPGEPGCRADVIILFTVDAKVVASYMVENNPTVFRPGGGMCCMSLTREALAEFAQSEKPVRWWHVSMPVDARTGQRAIVLPQDGTQNYPVISVAGPSRIHNGTRDDMYTAIVIVDGAKLNGTTWQQIGDYLAVISLAQINPNADLAEFDSILNLFSNPAAYSGLTDWDLSYVQALYDIDQERRPRLQVSELVREIEMRELDRE